MSAEQKKQEPSPNPNGNNNDNLNSETEHEEKQVQEEQEQAPRQSSTRTPFTNLSQVEADLALARTLQEQERAYMMLRMNNDGSDYGSWEAESYLHGGDDGFGDPHDHDITDGDEEEEDDDGEQEDEDEGECDGTDADDDDGDVFDVHAENGEEVNNASIELDPAAFSSDEAYARALQDAEEREVAARLLALAGINDRGIFTFEDHGGNSQDTWEEVDPDELSYEELLALGEVVGTESRGLSVDSLASLPSITYKAVISQIGSNESCVVCRVDYEDGDSLTLLSCKHSYHHECINNWLKINKVCPVCSVEVSTSGQS
ncbi:E3 ubiquitin ligase BIG BROTHER-related [Hibiscus syriacus]|uniref:E3 ubiquitin ligase BIG BROTHER-related n=1 Tax=Hibiscus syriacus TaxID=106335 RepID=A0A6A3BLT1_HIBSY|nr:E3 ubiquitin ligase BIG BROTHER-related-like [Hibiscus syriacus]KAE8716831.1 E3 ubiquitin ligase BIG BROTHER-related [Hibiscus syriacus]